MSNQQITALGFLSFIAISVISCVVRSCYLLYRRTHHGT